MRPDSNEELERALKAERRLTAAWYERISGQREWMPGERELMNRRMEDVGAEVNRLLEENAADIFAGLPSE